MARIGQNFDDYSGFQQIPGMPILLQQSVCTSFILPLARAEILHICWNHYICNLKTEKKISVIFNILTLLNEFLLQTLEVTQFCLLFFRV